MQIKKGDKKTIRGWVMYDWANSVYNLVISSALFPIFYEKVTTKQYAVDHKNLTWEAADSFEAAKNEIVTVDFFGWELSNTALISFVLSASFLVVAFFSPLLSGIADNRGNKKRYLQFFCYFGALACGSLYFFKDLLRDDLLEIGLLFLFFASIGFWNSLVFYNSYLPEIAEKEDQDRVSAKGFMMGYIGSMILLIACLILIKGFEVDIKYCFLLVALWWAGFAQFTYRVLPNKSQVKSEEEKKSIWSGFNELKHVFVEFRQTIRLKKYLTAFFFFNTGVQTVMLMATYFAKKEIMWPKDPITGKPDDSGLIVAILLIQLLGAGGAFLMSRLSNKIGNIKTLLISLSIWIGICLAAFFITTPVQFYALAATVGLVMGGVQAMARSTYSKFLPETTDNASYFSFYDATEKIGIVCGTLFFGIMELVTGDMRFSVVSVAFFFVGGFLLLLRVPKQEKQILLHSTDSNS